MSPPPVATPRAIEARRLCVASRRSSLRPCVLRAANSSPMVAVDEVAFMADGLRPAPNSVDAERRAQLNGDADGAVAHRQAFDRVATLASDVEEAGMQSACLICVDMCADAVRCRDMCMTAQVWPAVMIHAK